MWSTVSYIILRHIGNIVISEWMFIVIPLSYFKAHWQLCYFRMDPLIDHAPVLSDCTTLHFTAILRHIGIRMDVYCDPFVKITAVTSAIYTFSYFKL